jgi:hypothetical protein
MLDPSPLPEALNLTTFSTKNRNDPDLFLQCWRLTNCDDCLGSKHPCSWCAVSQTCVPNAHPFPIVAPIHNESICPLSWRERWEMRAKPFSCRCSTMTFMSVVVAVLSTLVGVLLIWMFWKLGAWTVRKWRKRQPGWWRVDGKNCTRRIIICGRGIKDVDQTSVSPTATEEERRPLLV